MALKILIIDDDPDDVALASRMLASEGLFETRPIVSAMAFAEALVDGAFDAAVVETKVHWADGLEIVAALKQRAPSKAVVLFSARATPALPRQWRSTGASTAAW